MYNKILNSSNTVKYLINQTSILEELTYTINESAYVPRFTLKNDEIFPDCPVNEPVKYSDALAIRAIKYGMIFLVNYKGEKDKTMTGSERVAYFMVLGKSSKNKPLVRVYHLKGWSVSENNDIEKTWRMFRTDRILSMTFTGMFFRLPPEGYKQQDSGMTGGIIASADFSVIRRNQEELVKKMKIQDTTDVNVTTKSKGSKSKNSTKGATVIVNNTDSKVDILNVMDNPYIAKIEDIDNLRVTFLKSIYKDLKICILGALGEKNKLVEVKFTTNGKNPKKLGTFKVLDSISGKMFKRIKNVKGDSVYDLYIFDKKEE